MTDRQVQDPVYGAIPMDPWVGCIIDTPQFDRLHGISLSSLPPRFWPALSGTTRWQHSLGVYHIAAHSRPNDPELQAASLLHDLGQPPFSHLVEHLMVDRLGADHEERAAELIDRMDASRLAPEIDWAEVPYLILGQGRGRLLHGRMDYDNIDYLLRQFDDLHDTYNPERLAAGLVVVGRTVALRSEVEGEALAWRETRREFYGRLYSHGNLVPHAMLRKAVELVAWAGELPPSFFDLTNDQALAFLAGFDVARPILDRLWALAPYTCVWEAETDPELKISWHQMLEFEAEIAARAGLAAHEVVVNLSTSRASRALPPLLVDGQLRSMPAPDPSPRVFHVFVAEATERVNDAAEAVLEQFVAKKPGCWLN